MGGKCRPEFRLYRGPELINPTAHAIAVHLPIFLLAGLVSGPSCNICLAFVPGALVQPRIIAGIGIGAAGNSCKKEKPCR